MGYLVQSEAEKRLANVQKMLESKNLDLALVYYDEFNIGNGWYLTGWCPQFESGAVLVPRKGTPMLLGGPESEPFAKLDSAITETRNFPVFMVPDEEYPNATIIDFPKLFAELNQTLGAVKAVGLVGADRMPAACYRGIVEGFAGVKLVDITNDFVKLRYNKSPWEIEQIRAAFGIADHCYNAMKAKVANGVSEIEIAAAGEFAARSRGASGFGFSAIVGSGARANAVVPTASSKKVIDGEMVMIGLAPKINGYAGVMGDALPVSGEYSARQKECIKYLREAFCMTKEQLVVGKTGYEIDAPARAYFQKHGFTKYLVCPFVHTIGLHEAESPFFGPGSQDVLVPGMTVCVDVSFFGHPEFHGVRIETGYEITEQGAIPLSVQMDKIHTAI
ncbi:MAG: aminopeptidase P family protein [Lentisphaerae bacterium]|nr:Xaa-Pro peptidase family protein [Victivallaceae bacterium]MDD3703912.1 Xaa-Pro peptidase family protein [Victivallaceae bacterium]MDD5663689.1 Xaa-Pro peptidase family protein [Victivallaceae bacterium]NLK82709.1 aminopeptidase P family protein [Lentisphaerota bacterium]